MSCELKAKLRRRRYLAEGEKSKHLQVGGSRPAGSESVHGIRVDSEAAMEDSTQTKAGSDETVLKNKHTQYFVLEPPSPTDFEIKLSPPPTPPAHAQKNKIECGTLVVLLIALSACLLLFVDFHSSLGRGSGVQDQWEHIVDAQSSLLDGGVEQHLPRDAVIVEQHQPTDTAESQLPRDVDGSNQNPLNSAIDEQTQNKGGTVQRVAVSNASLTEEQTAWAGDMDCWAEGFTFDVCCSPVLGLGGNAYCWDTVFTYEKCCTRGRQL